MTGRVFRRGRSWSVVYDELPDPETGKRRQRSKGGFKTQREAQAFLTAQLSKLGDGSYTAPAKTTVGEYLTGEWLPAASGNLRPLSVTKYESVIRLYIVPTLGPVRLQALSPGHLNGLYARLDADGLGASTQRLVHAVLGRALKDAMRWGKLTRNPATMADPPARPEPRAKAWTAGEVARFLRHVEGDRLAALWRLAATTGMRRGELAGLSWRSLDLGGSRLSVDQQLVPTRGGVTFGAPKVRRSRRTIALDTQTVDVLREHRATQQLERAFAADAYTDRDLVFADELGGPIHPQRLTEAFARHRKAAGIPTGTLHTLRHSAATLALVAGVPIHIIAARLGDDPKTILTTYAHLLPQSDELAAERVAAALVAP
jgi:integrase